MAQHYDARKFPQKVFKKIVQSIEREVSKGLSYTSMKWQRHEWQGKVFWETSRHIGKGHIAGSDRGTFEVHLNNTGRIAEQIYLVA